MTLEEIQESWEHDCAIDGDHLDKESIRTPNLHAKYLNLLIGFKLKLVKTKKEYNTLRQFKFRYYRGELSKSDLQTMGWDQWQGVKPLKNEMEEFLEGDADLAEAQLKQDYFDSIISYLESIMQQIKSRDWQIRNSIEWKKFISGA
jgi:hypothetical protein